MRGLRRTEKFEQTSQVTRTGAKAKGSRLNRKAGRGERGSHCEASRAQENGRTESGVPEPEGAHGNRRDGRGKPGSESGTGAPKEPLPGEIGKKGKAGAES